MVERINLPTKLLEVGPQPSGQPFLSVCDVCVREWKRKRKRSVHLPLKGTTTNHLIHVETFFMHLLFLSIFLLYSKFTIILLPHNVTHSLTNGMKIESDRSKAKIWQWRLFKALSPKQNCCLWRVAQCLLVSLYRGRKKPGSQLKT